MHLNSIQGSSRAKLQALEEKPQSSGCGFLFVCLFVCFERGDEGAERERKTERESQAGSVLSAQNLMQGYKSRTHEIVTKTNVGRFTG